MQQSGLNVRQPRPSGAGRIIDMITLFTLMVGSITGCSAHRNLHTADSLKQAPRIDFLLDLGVDASHEESLQSHTVRGIVLRIDNNAPEPFKQRVAIKLDGGETRELLVVMPSVLTLPFHSGERLIIHTTQRWDKHARRLRQAFHIQDGKKETRLVFQQNNLLPVQHIPPGLEITPGKRVRYTESKRIEGMCFATIEHRDLTLSADNQPTEMPPGRIQMLHLDVGSFQWMAVDNRVTLESNCDGYRDDAIIWIALRAESP